MLERGSRVQHTKICLYWDIDYFKLFAFLKFNLSCLTFLFLRYKIKRKNF